MIEKLSKALGAALVSNIFSQIQSKISCHLLLVAAYIYKALKPFDSWTEYILQE